MIRLCRVPWKNGAKRFTPRQQIRNQSTKPRESKESKELKELKELKEPIDIPSPQAWHQRLGPVTDFFSWFHKTQTRRPLTVQLSTSTLVYLLGDICAQEIGGEEYDGSRTLRMLAIGMISSIPGYKW